MSYQSEPIEPQNDDSFNLGRATGLTAVKAVPLTVSEALLQHSSEKKRLKRGILADSEEKRVFEKILYLPYIDFTYQYPVQRGFLSKQSAVGQGRSVALALREVDFGFYPELASLARQVIDIDLGQDSIIPGVDSTTLIDERLDELKQTLSEYDRQLQELSSQCNSLLKTDPTRQAIKDNIDHLKGTRDTRWKMFADGLKLPSRIDLEKIELLEGSLFYMPYFIVKFILNRESRFLVWDREGKESDSLADELEKNHKFRELVQSHAMS